MTPDPSDGAVALPPGKLRCPSCRGYGASVHAYGPRCEQCERTGLVNDTPTGWAIAIVAAVDGDDDIPSLAAALANPALDWHDEHGEPLVCSDCGRPMAYDTRTDTYRHLIGPGRGCFLIGPEPDWISAPDWMTPS